MRAVIWGATLALVSMSAVYADDTAMTAAPSTTETVPPAPPTPPAATTPVTPDSMTVLFGNTIIVKGSGPESHTRYSADHTFEGIAPEYNYPYKGTWEITADGKLCRTFDPAVPTVSNPDCDAAPPGGHAVGDSWTDDKGNTISIVAGIQ
jgi:hypothetical protein